MRPGKIVGIGWNYQSHLGETQATRPKEPIVVLKPSSSLIGDGDDIVIPAGVGRVDHELELAVIIGERVKDVDVDSAVDLVTHVAVFNDITAREIQDRQRETGLPWALSKGLDTFSVMSCLVDVEGLGIEDLDMSLTVNGELRQEGNTRMMMFTVAELISFISRYMTLEPGDVIATGTPEGVGPLEHGDLVEARIERVGVLRNRVCRI